eukprot:1136487-Pelagomonas_calceolata.AAC.4
MGKAERGRSSTWGGIRTPLQKAVALFTPSKSGGGGHADGVRHSRLKSMQTGSSLTLLPLGTRPQKRMMH